MTQVPMPTGLVSPDRFMKETGIPLRSKDIFIFFLKEHGFAQINMVYDGNNNITIDNPDKLRPGTYILQMLNDGDPQ